MRVPTQPRRGTGQRPGQGGAERPGVRRRVTIALVAACALGAVAVPMALAGPSTAPAAAPAAPAAPVAVAAAGDGRLLPTPEAPRISDGSYAGFQQCGDPSGDPVVSGETPTLAATLESVAPPGSAEPEHPGPRRKVAFEIDTAAGKNVLRRQLTSDTSHDAALQLPRGTLGDGAYRWRVRVRDASASSEWTAWCAFTVARGGGATR
ncbi:hypothetical protein [Streptomyces laurentii]|uniref:hypothetical protein n=1 Tax=Streptomyces laurentii TaxID=39478 RepID=UPI0033FC975E